MPIDYKDYHPKWTLIVRLIKKRAKDKCEWCGLKNYRIIRRLKNGDFESPKYMDWQEIKWMRKSGYSFSQAIKKLGLTKVILTTAHLDHDKTNNRFSNLASLCQRCHLKHDLPHHINNRKYGRDWKKYQLSLDFNSGDESQCH